jgi:TP901 family phage tail tape measure protein
MALGAGADLIIRIATKGADLASAQMKKLGATSGTTGKHLGKLGKITAGVTAVGFIALAKGVTEAVQAFTEFDSKMTQSLAIMNTTVQEQEAMVRAAQEVASTTTISANQSAEAFFFLASAGLDAEQSIGALPQVAKFAQAGMFDMATATDLATDAQSALGLTVQDAQQNMENLTRVTDVLVKANTLANASVQQFSEALTTKAGAALKVVNKDIEEGVAVLAVFADRGVKGAEAGDKLNQVLRDIPRATAKNSEEFAKLGLQMFDAEGNMKNVADIIEELDAVLGPMSDELKASTLDQLGLNRGVADAVKILSGTTDQIREYEQALRDAGGTTEEVANKQLDTLQAELDILSNKWNILLTDIGKDFEGTARQTVGIFDRLIQSIIDYRNAVDDREPIKNYSYELRTVSREYADGIVRVKRLVQVTEDLEKSHDAERDAVESYISGLTDLRNTKEEVVDTTQDEIDAEEELAQTRKEESLGALNKVYSAYQKMNKIKENITDLENEEKKALKNLNKEMNAEKGFISRRDYALEQLNKEKEKSKEVTAEEQLAIERQKEAIQKLLEVENRSKVQNLELQVAQQRLTELIQESTSATQAEEQAQREYQRALDDLEKQQEKIKKAQEEYRQAQEDLAKATANSTENLLAMAIAKKELDDAIADAQAIGALEEGIRQMVTNVGGDLDKLRASFQSIFNMAGKNVSPFTGGPSVPTSPQTGGVKFPASGGAEVPTGGFTDIGGGLARYNNTNFITVNPQSILGTPQEIEEAVARALQEGARRGINVAF